MATQPESQVPARSSTRFSRWWGPLTAAGVLSSALLVSSNLVDLHHRLAQSERLQSQDRKELRVHLDGVRTELSGIRTELETAFSQMSETQALSQRLQKAEDHLGSIGSAIEAHTSTLDELEETQASFGSGLERELQQRDERLLDRYEALNQLVADAQQKALESKDRLERLDERLATPPDLRGLWRQVVGPVVQLAGDSSVGSGVLLHSEADPESGGFRTYLLTAWHVVRDIQGDPPDLSLPVPVQIYAEDGSTRSEKAHLLVHDVKLDAALLELRTSDALEFGATLAPRERLLDVRIFDTVVAVGCPLGNDPIPTRGEIATCHHEVDGETYWMINAPTYIGNSGGGIFDSKTHELLGIFSKIYTHGSLRPTIVPHMGLVTPLSKIYEWLARVGHPDIVPHSQRADVASNK